MKKLSVIYKWIILSVLLQVAILAYFNFIYLPNRGSVKATMYELAEDSIVSKSIRTPTDAKNIAVSYNGLFTAYMQGSNLVITDVKNNKKLKSLSPSNGVYSYYRWLPDRDMLIYSVKSSGGKAGQVQILTFDVGPGLERSYPKITGLSEGSEVIDIELSPLTNVVYTMIKTGATRTKVYKYNIMDNLSFVMNTDINTILKETAYSDNLVYQKAEDKIVLRSGKNGGNNNLSLKGKVVLLAVDSEDNIYAGELNEEKMITSIRFGKYDQQVKTWKQIVLDAPALSSDVFVTPDGAVYRASRQEKRIYAVGDKNDISYEGELLDVLDDYVVSRDNNLLKLTVLHKGDLKN